MMKRILLRLKGIIGNLTSGRRGFQLAYVAETYDWAIKQDSEAITDALNRQGLLKTRVTYCPCLLKNQLIHFGSANTFFTKHDWNQPHPSNNVVLTWFHIVDGDPRVKRLVEIQKDVDVIHTSCESTKRTLVEAGIHADKIVVIPLGVDLELFTPVTKASRRAMRDRLGIPDDRFVIGSFQKDGVGWGDGLEPKLIKGPDILVETLARLKQHNPLVLLTGPSRGYVKNRLDKLGIDYAHTYLKDIDELPQMYHALDLYLIASRLEGGPKAILEAWASGIPLVSTHVGMVPDIARDGENVLLCTVEDVDGLTRACERIISDTQTAKGLASDGLKAVQEYAWSNIAERYYHELYSSLL